MLTIPSVLNFEDVTVFPDDEDCNQFYLLSTTPRVRTFAEGTPAFQGLFWTDKANGTSNSTAGLAGAAINFDVNLGISEDKKEKIKKAIKTAGIQKTLRNSILKQEKERLGKLAKAQGKTPSSPDIPPVGKIRFGAIHFKEGTVSILQESTETDNQGNRENNLVAWSSAGATASLIGDNNAAFAMRLGSDGAAIWYKALKQDAIGIGIRYELVMPVRLPSLEIRAYAGTSQDFELQRKVERVTQNVDRGCTDADVQHINVSEITSHLREEGLVNIEISKGSSNISDEHVSQLRNMMMGLINEKITEIIKSRIHGMTEEERKNSLIELIVEEINAFVELRYTQRDVVDWKVAPQGTIMQFIEEVPEDKRDRMALVVDISENIVETITIPIEVDAPWDENPFVNVVKVHCKYPTAKKEKTFLFNKSTTSKKWHLRRPKDDDGIVQYTTEVYFKGVQEPFISPTKTTNGAISINVGKKGVINLTFKPHPVLNSLSGKNKILSVQSSIRYLQEGADRHFTETLIFTPTEKDGSVLTKNLYSPVIAPLEYQIKYFTQGGDIIEMPTKKYYLSENDKGEIYSPSPFENKLEIGVELGITPSESLKKIIVEFKYEDEENNFESTEKIELSGGEDGDEWGEGSWSTELVQMDEAIDNYHWRYKIISDSNVSRTKWIEGVGDQTIILPILPVRINVSRLGLGDEYTAAEIILCYEEPDHNFVVKDQLFIMEDESEVTNTWYIPRMSPSNNKFTYSLILYDLEGNVEEYNDLKGKGRFLMIQKPR